LGKKKKKGGGRREPKLLEEFTNSKKAVGTKRPCSMPSLLNGEREQEGREKEGGVSARASYYHRRGKEKRWEVQS